MTIEWREHAKTYGFHSASSLLFAGKEAAKEAIVVGLWLETWGQIGDIAVLGIHWLRVLGLVDSVVDHSHGFVSVQEIGMASVDVDRLHTRYIAGYRLHQYNGIDNKEPDNLEYPASLT